MHASAPEWKRPWIWLFSGTGEGPPLADALRQRGWGVRVWVVSAAAARAYAQAEDLVVEVGAIGGLSCLRGALEGALAAGRGPSSVVDATHPFAQRISADLALVCSQLGVPLVRLARASLPPEGATVLRGLADLEGRALAGRSLLLAIGARQLADVLTRSRGARHYARILPNATALAQAMAAGLAPGRVACLHPTGEGLIERALCRRWGIEVVLARQSGGSGEGLWHGVTAELGLELLLLERPSEPAGVPCLGTRELLQRLEGPKWIVPPG
jgi:precorrin-6A/cobalt-precorrin-6A reductase